MKHISVTLVLIALFFYGFPQAPTDILMNIGGKDISKAEFERIYYKNNSQGNQVDKKSVDEYLDLFINFKLKVIEAESLKMDTVKSFIDELAGYRKQLAKPYLTDSKIDEELLLEAYERSKWDIRASHILVQCTEDALPADTLVAYKKIMKIRDRIVKGEDFNKVAAETSEDPSAKNNQGDLGYFTVFSMVYPFETAAYNAEIKKVTMPVRTRFGYHLLWVSDKRPNQGEIKVAHIMVASPRNTTPEDAEKAREKIFALYDSLKAGKDFAKLAEIYSDDKGSGRKGGELPVFGTGRMIPEFETAAFKLQNTGDYTEPVQTAYGWHIIKLLEKYTQKSFEEVKPKFKSQLAKDMRLAKSKSATIERLKKEYQFKVDAKSLAEFYPLADSSMLKGTWDLAKAVKLKKNLFSFAGKNYTQQDFAQYLSTFKYSQKLTDLKQVIDKAFSHYTEKLLLDYEDSKLEDKYADFRDLMQEYHDGILLFELTDKMVWSKAVQDTAGLQAFYESNKSNYMWDERFQGTLYFCKNEKVKKNLEKLLLKKTDKPLTPADVEKKFTKDTIRMVTSFSGIFSKGDQPKIDYYFWKTGSYIPGQNEFVVVSGSKRSPEPKKLDECRGLVIADYQNYLEKIWIEQLRVKYPVNINKEVLETLK